MKAEARSLYVFHDPHYRRIESGISSASQSLCGRGFMIAPFMPGGRKLYISASVSLSEEELRNAVDDALKSMPDCTPASTSETVHRRAVEEICRREREGAVEKVVVARNKTIDIELDPLALFKRLCKSYPSAYTYLFYTPESGMWVGSSPELLLRFREGIAESVPLAGTRVRGESGLWSVKDVREHHVVVDHIAELFGRYCRDRRVDGSRVRRAGPVEHLMTRIEGKVHPDVSFLEFLDALSPTPALGGAPREAALHIIRELEDFDRGAYGGYCGPVDFDSHTSDADGWNCKEANLCVTIRCARIFPKAAMIIAGGGIMPDSDPESEWLETERKMNTLLPLISESAGDFTIDINNI